MQYHITSDYIVEYFFFMCVAKKGKAILQFSDYSNKVFDQPEIVVTD